jgi:hypothetical protein
MAFEYGSGPAQRPLIALNSDGKVTHDGSVCRVVVRRSLVRVACTDITPEALKKVLKDWEAHFGKPEEVVVQDGL